MRNPFRKRTEHRALSAENIPPAMLSGSPSSNVTPHNATAIGDCYACVRALSDAAASVPLVPYRRTAAGRERVEGGRLVELLRQPAPGVTQANLIGQIVAHLNLHGNAYVGKYKSGGLVEQLALLAPDRVQVEIKGGRPLYTYTSPGGQRATLTTDDVVHVRSLSTDGVLGLSPIRQARVVLGLSDRLAKHASRYFENDATPRGVVKIADSSAEAVTRMREDWRNRLGGPENAYGLAFVSGDVEYQPVAFPQKDLEFIAQRKLSAVEVATIFRVPPWVIGADSGESMTYSNVESQALAFVQFALMPHLRVVEQAISNDTDLCFERVFTEFLVDGLLRADSLTRSQVYEKALAGGWMTVAEIRQRENLSPEELPAAAAAAATSNGTGNPDRIPEGAMTND